MRMMRLDVRDEVNAQEDAEEIYEPEEMVEECEAECDWINYGHELVINPEYVEYQFQRYEQAQWRVFRREIDWIICGAESGPGKRLIDIDTVREIKNMCVQMEIPFFYKQGPGDDIVWGKMPTLDGRVWDQIPEWSVADRLF